MYALITKEIHDHGVQEPALVSWLNDEHKHHAFEEWFNNPTPDIRSITNPPKNGQYNYQDPDYFHFVNNN